MTAIATRSPLARFTPAPVPRHDFAPGHLQHGEQVGHRRPTVFIVSTADEADRINAVGIAAIGGDDAVEAVAIGTVFDIASAIISDTCAPSVGATIRRFSQRGIWVVSSERIAMARTRTDFVQIVGDLTERCEAWEGRLGW